MTQLHCNITQAIVRIDADKVEPISHGQLVQVLFRREYVIEQKVRQVIQQFELIFKILIRTVRFVVCVYFVDFRIQINVILQFEIFFSV